MQAIAQTSLASLGRAPIIGPRKGATAALRGGTSAVAPRRSRVVVTRAVISGGESAIPTPTHTHAPKHTLVVSSRVPLAIFVVFFCLLFPESDALVFLCHPHPSTWVPPPLPARRGGQFDVSLVILPAADTDTTTQTQKTRKHAKNTKHKKHAGAIENLAQVVVPEDLISIRAYVRWEEAGKPEDTTPEWQAVSARTHFTLPHLLVVFPRVFQLSVYFLQFFSSWHFSRYFAVKTPNDDSQCGPCNPSPAPHRHLTPPLTHTRSTPLPLPLPPKQAEFAKARLDLQLELLQSTSLNEIRKRYNQDAVDGDDEPLYKVGRCTRCIQLIPIA
jgi:hypothetical protein